MKRKLYIVLIVISCITFLTYLVLTIKDCIILSLCSSCSAPWYTPLVTYSFIFSIPLFIETLLLVFLYKRQKAQK